MQGGFSPVDRQKVDFSAKRIYIPKCPRSVVYFSPDRIAGEGGFLNFELCVVNVSVNSARNRSLGKAMQSIPLKGICSRQIDLVYFIVKIRARDS